MVSVLTDDLISYVHKWTGIKLEKGKQQLIEERIRRLIEINGLKNTDELTRKLINKDPLIVNQFLKNITINETLWYRDKNVFNAIFKVIEKIIEEKGQVRIWSAACSYGQEPYSIAMHFFNKSLQHNVKIYATDLDKHAIDTAQKGLYESFSMNRGLTKEYRDKYFKRNEEFWEIDSGIKSMVKFSYMNLNEINSFDEKVDVVLLRNVLIYFSAEKKIDILKGVESKMNDNSVLFIGGCESILGLNDAFKMTSIDNSIYYQK
jgi:chemotaxis protein methyltransferase CheR